MIPVCETISGQRLLFVMAADAEYGPQLRTRFAPLMTGVGPIEAALATGIALHDMARANALPDLVVCLGSAGSRICGLGEVVQVASVSWRDMDASRLGFVKGVTPFADHPVDLPLVTPLTLPSARLSTGANIVGGDDYAAMRQALTRRFKRVKKGEDYMPDLLLIDGGKGQLGVAVEALEELGVTGVNVIGVAKGSTRKPGLEQIFLPGEKSPLILPADSPGLHLIQQIRDEAHRFAIAGHRGQRGKARQASMLDGVDGLGPKRRKKLLQTFGGPKQVARAGVSELARVEGISATMAQRIYDHFHNTA